MEEWALRISERQHRLSEPSVKRSWGSTVSRGPVESPTWKIVRIHWVSKKGHSRDSIMWGLKLYEEEGWIATQQHRMPQENSSESVMSMVSLSLSSILTVKKGKCRAAFLEEPGSVPSTDMAAHSPSLIPVPGDQSPLLASKDTACIWCTAVQAGKTLRNSKFFF